jgi:hypothetical protein
MASVKAMVFKVYTVLTNAYFYHSVHMKRGKIVKSTLWSIAALDKQIVAELIKKDPAIYEMRGTH